MLYLLRPRKDKAEWNPWYDKAFGFVIVAESEPEARGFAADECGDEGAEAWTSTELSECRPLTDEGPSGIVMRDFASA